MTGCIRACLAKFGNALFIDESRGGICTSGFQFWIIILIDSAGTAKYNMGVMTMSSTYEAVGWLLESLASMYTCIVVIAKVVISYFGKGILLCKRVL